jgi:hypothetical protein
MNHAFFYDSPNHLSELGIMNDIKDTNIRVIDVEDYKAGYFLELTMDDEKGQAVAYLMPAGKT